MAVIVGFNQDIADKQHSLKREAQRKASVKFAGRNIHFVKSYRLANPVMKG
jgi:hypothetical protein